MPRRWATLVCAACATPKPAPAPPRPPVQVVGASCVSASDADARITQVLAAHHASGLLCNITETGGEPAAVTLQVVRDTGEVGLDRSYTFGPTDCASAPQLLALTVDRWLTSFPEWAEPAAPRAPTTWNELAVVAAINSMAPPLGVEGEVGALFDRGPRANRFGATVLVRASVPQAFGSGHFQQTAFLAGASWRRQMGAWTSRVELRGGALLVSGIGLAENARDWLAWWEVGLFGGRNFGWGSLGLEVAATALRDHAVTRDRLVSEDIPLVRVGLGGMFQIR